MMGYCMYFVYEIDLERIVSCSNSLSTESMIAKRMYDCGFNVKVVIADVDISGIDFNKGIVNEYKHEEEL